MTTKPLKLTLDLLVLVVGFSKFKTKYPNNELKIALFHRFIQKLMIRLD